MSDRYCVVSFPETDYPPLTLPQHQNLSECLTIQNSPVLFGCRTGICGTCLVAIEGNIPPASEEEKEILEAIAPGSDRVRLACQIDLTNDIKITLL
ncbi:MAG: (2Fe-2S)-binding protein [Cyanosarcina radialis HA8281-LM2]|jgi:ferredoxin|nr:(2Fe-2S)-binding protein [Cyanosarcina radialis HA8281-LM2]